MALTVVVAPKAGGTKVEDQLEVDVAKEMAVDGPAEQAIRLVEGAAMRLLAAGKNKSGAGFCLTTVERDRPQAAFVGSLCCFVAVAAHHIKH